VRKAALSRRVRTPSTPLVGSYACARRRNEVLVLFDLGRRLCAPYKVRLTMARVALIKEDEHPELSGLVEKLRAGRRGRLLNIYRTLLNTPALAESWFDHSNAVRWKTTLGGRLREIVIIRIGHLTQCEYVLRQHVPTLALADGFTLEECSALADWQDSKFFTARERAALTYADTMTREIAVPDAVFEEVRRHFDDRALVELTVLIGSYNMNARVLKALAVDLEPGA
jgi:4-carboxymuconolactone decarboxylase